MNIHPPTHRRNPRHAVSRLIQGLLGDVHPRVGDRGPAISPSRLPVARVQAPAGKP